MKKELLSYFSKILEIGLKVQKDDILIVHFNDTIPTEIKQILEELKQKYELNEILIYNTEYKKVYKFLNTNPNEKEINDYIKHIEVDENYENAKLLVFDLNKEMTALYGDIYRHPLWEKYENIEKMKNKKINHFVDKATRCTSVLPYKKDEYGKFHYDKSILKCLPEQKEMKNLIQFLENMKIELNNMQIEKLEFYNNLGTELIVGLSPYSIWTSANAPIYSVCPNFPSYEIYTSPDCTKVNGTVVMTKKIEFFNYGEVNEAKLEFKEGKVKSVKSNNESFEKVIMNNKNKMNMLGEIALVSNDSPVAKQNKIFEEKLLNENTGCHFALGDAIDECIEFQKGKTKEELGFNTSNWHEDITFGDKSLHVEAVSKGKRRVLIDNGKWKI